MLGYAPCDPTRESYVHRRGGSVNADVSSSQVDALERACPVRGHTGAVVIASPHLSSVAHRAKEKGTASGRDR